MNRFSICVILSGAWYTRSRTRRVPAGQDLGFSNSPKFSRSTQYLFSRVCAKKASLPTSFPRIHSGRGSPTRRKICHSHQTQDSDTSATCRPCGVRLRRIRASTQNDASADRHPDRAHRASRNDMADAPRRGGPCALPFFYACSREGINPSPTDKHTVARSLACCGLVYASS